MARICLLGNLFVSVSVTVSSDSSLESGVENLQSLMLRCAMAAQPNFNKDHDRMEYYSAKGAEESTRRNLPACEYLDLWWMMADWLASINDFTAKDYRPNHIIGNLDHHITEGAAADLTNARSAIQAEIDWEASGLTLHCPWRDVTMTVTGRSNNPNRTIILSKSESIKQSVKSIRRDTTDRPCTWHVRWGKIGMG